MMLLVFNSAHLSQACLLGYCGCLHCLICQELATIQEHDLALVMQTERDAVIRAEAAQMREAEARAATARKREAEELAAAQQKREAEAPSAAPSVPPTEADSYGHTPSEYCPSVGLTYAATHSHGAALEAAEYALWKGNMCQPYIDSYVRSGDHANAARLQNEVLDAELTARSLRIEELRNEGYSSDEAKRRADKPYDEGCVVM